ncbi:MAG TPA: glycosyltransferase [Chthoniobacteraceae bacterium]|nr:glycosyltransferase [Chthoniobacteraceae bacterium]
MKRALIATVFNEADNITRWWNCLLAQTVAPDEIVIVDGGSTDGTWEKLQELAGAAKTSVRLDRRRCNIAEGRNLAIQLASADIIASTDAGSFPAPDWFAEITRPLLDDPTVDVTGGPCPRSAAYDFRRYLEQFEPPVDPNVIPKGEIHPSSRNTAFRRSAWADAGGYPEWLTLTAEDALFTAGLHKIGKKFHYTPKAVVEWLGAPDAPSYFKMLHRYGFGSAEARLHAEYFLQRLAITVFPFLLLFSRWRFSHLAFRYRKNFSSAAGWLAGMVTGHRPPPGWKRIDGIFLSPEAQRAAGAPVAPGANPV